MATNYTDNYLGPLHTLTTVGGNVVTNTTQDQQAGVDAVSVFNKTNTIKEPDGWREPTNYRLRKYYFSYPRGKERETHPSYPDYSMVKTGYVRSHTGINSDFRWEIEDVAIMAKLRQRAEVNALLKLKDQKINLAQAFGERKQTAGLLADFALRSVDTIRKIRRADLRGAAANWGVTPNLRRSTKTVAQLWLELQYGWKPFLSDIHGACEALAEKDANLPKRYTVSVKARAEEEISWARTANEANPATYSDYHLKGKRGVLVRLDYFLKNQFTGSLAQLGLTDPLTLAWELMPWSFVVDWALPIGDWLQSLRAADGFTFRGGTYTEYNDGRTKVLYPKSYTSFGYTTVRTDVQARQHWKLVNRVKYGSSPIPKFPGLKDPVSFLHVANALALMRGAFKDGGQRIRVR